MKQELVSVIIPCYNAASFLRETIDSVLEQTFPYVELIVVDDGSTDDSWDIIQSYGESIKGVQLNHMGGCHARNYGASIASGRFLMFLDADDLIAPTTLESLVAALGNQIDCVAACKWRRLTKEGNDWVRLPSGVPLDPPDGDYIRGWLTGWYFPPCTILWPREVYERTGGWDEELSANQDGDLMLRALLDGVHIVTAEVGEAYYREHGVSRLSVSTNIASEKALRSRMRVLEKVTAKLEQLGMLDHYAVAVSIAYHKLARNNFETNADLARECWTRAEMLSGSKAISGTWTHRILCRLLGLERKEQIARTLARFGIMKGERRKSTQLRKLKQDLD